MIETHCPICGINIDYKVIYRENLPLSETVFSTRKAPDNYHYRIVKCNRCGLLYSNPILENDQINKLYEESKFDYGAELENLKKTYGNYLKKIENLVPSKENLLDIGCGNGFFLEKALEMGYKNVYGVEPSNKAIENVSIMVEGKIINDVFNSKDFSSNFFDVICFFQVIEHIVDLNDFLIGCLKSLKKGGIILCIAHDSNAFFPKILKDRCPIINNEHIWIFNKETLKKIFLKYNFQVIKVGPVANIYSLTYWFKMMPIPKFLNKFIFNLLSFLKIANKRISIKAGNIFIVAKK
ncbi:MAG: class I SAM-dependent methyltransferase [Patescibacteria group bacterium]